MIRLAIAAALMAAAAHGAEIDEQVRAVIDERCAAEAELADRVMTGRQLGIPIAKAMELTREFPHFVIDAYEEPRWTSEERQRKAIRDFSDRAAVRCYRTLSQ